MDDDSEHEADDDMGYDPSDVSFTEFEMIKYSFGQDEEYVAIKEDEYDDLARTIIKEYLEKVSKRRALWSLNEDILKINYSKDQYAVSIKKIRRIRACTHQRPQWNEAQYAVSREDQYAVLEI
ncbi:hypothetical protein Tco_0122481 [Tanacetum coccineum]